MSSAKDYILEISEVDSSNVATYTVRGQPSFFYRYVRVPLVTVLTAVFLAFGFRTSEKLGGPSVDIGVDVNGIDKTIALLCRFITTNVPTGDIDKDTLETWLLVLATTAIFIVTILLILLQESEDSMMVMKDTGIQLSSRRRWKFFTGTLHHEFIPISDIIDIVVHEGFHGFGQVIFYMCVLTKARSSSGLANNGIKVVFPNFLPRKAILLDVWRSSRMTLFGTTRRHYRRVPGAGLKEV